MVPDDWFFDSELFLSSPCTIFESVLKRKKIELTKNDSPHNLKICNSVLCPVGITLFRQY